MCFSRSLYWMKWPLFFSVMLSIPPEFCSFIRVNIYIFQARRRYKKKGSCNYYNVLCESPKRNVIDIAAAVKLNAVIF
ncbi:uncharacterized protein EV154DRAFT_525552, partial [Mucor mucedo]|uniref:uncharacterized protein n=1 Tax=Mucor mucedo TaxID=29922 RepID=UPI002220BFF9